MADEGFLSQAILNGVQAGTAMKAQRLDQQKYEQAKAQQAIANAQKEEEIRNVQAGQISQSGSGGQEWQAQNDAFNNAVSARADSPQSLALGGSGSAYFNAKNPYSSDQPDNTETASEDEKSFDNAQGGGVLNKPPGSGFISQQPQQGSNLATIPSVNAQSNPGAQNVNPYTGAAHIDPMAIRMMPLQAAQKAREDADAATLASLKEGGTQKFTANPSGGSANYSVSGETSPIQQAKLSTDIAGGRGAMAGIGARFQDDPIVKNAVMAQSPMSKAIDSYKNLSDDIANGKTPNSEDQYNLFAQAAKVAGLKDETPEDVLKHGTGSLRLRNMADQIIRGTASQDTFDNVIKDSYGNYASAVTGMRQQMPLYQGQGQQSGVNTSNVVAAPAVMKTLSDANKIMAKFNPQNQQQQIGGLMAGEGGSPASASQQNPIIQAAQREIERRRAKKGQ